MSIRSYDDDCKHLYAPQTKVLAGGYQESDLVTLYNGFPASRPSSVSFSEYGYAEDSDIEDEGEEGDDDHGNDGILNIRSPLPESSTVSHLN